MSAMDYFDRFADEQFAKDGGAIVAGLLAAEATAPYVANTTVPGVGYTIQSNGVDQIVSGGAVVVGTEFAPVDGRMQRFVQLGGAASMMMGAADRFGIKGFLPSA